MEGYGVEGGKAKREAQDRPRCGGRRRSAEAEKAERQLARRAALGELGEIPATRLRSRTRCDPPKGALAGHRDQPHQPLPAPGFTRSDNPCNETSRGPPSPAIPPSARKAARVRTSSSSATGEARL
jgi:hypothetical protein